jgi:hypothetical protein
MQAVDPIRGGYTQLTEILNIRRILDRVHQLFFFSKYNLLLHALFPLLFLSSPIS